MKKSAIQVMSLCLCGALVLGGAGVRALAAGGGTEAPQQPAPAVSGPASAPSSADETVYVLTGPDGSVEKVIVSDWLKNGAGSGALADDARLENVENVKGGETFSAGGGARVWDARGNDIFSQGTSDQDPPVDLTVSYTLDGRAVTPEELAGKSGRVTIRFDYANREYRMMDVDGQQEKIYVPFAVLTGLALDNDIFRNVEVTNGRIYNDGDRTAVVGIAFPGLRENLDVDPEKLELPSHVEIAADVTGFRLGTTFTAAVSGPFGELDTDRLNETGGLSDSLGQLTDAMDRLMDGADRLHDGLDALLEKSGVLAEGVSALSEGAAALQSGADALGTGADQLRQGTEALSAGLDTLTESSAALNAGAMQIFDTLLAAAGQQLTAAGVTLPAELTAENYGTILDGVAAALPEAAAKPVVQLKASLDSCSQFYQGLQGYTAGVAQAAAGAGELKTGAAQLSGGMARLSEGAAELSGGIGALESGVPALTDGVTQLRDGSQELAGGLAAFNRDGVQKLADAVDGGLESLTARLRATAEAARGYQSFSGLHTESDSQVKFIYRTAPIGDAE